MRMLLAILFVTLPVALVYAQAPALQPPVSAASDQNKSATDQNKPAADQNKPADQNTQAPPAPSPPTESYTYDPAGRRDPFLNLLNSGTDPRPASGREGPASMTVAEISVRGVLQTRGEMIAMIKGPDNKTYTVHAGDKLLDGTIKSVTTQGLIILQQVNDPLSLVKEREVRKTLRSVEDGKE